MSDDMLRAMRAQKRARARPQPAPPSESAEPARVDLVTQGPRSERVRREPTPDELFRAAVDAARGRPTWHRI